jgi:cell division protein FtsW
MTENRNQNYLGDSIAAVVVILMAVGTVLVFSAGASLTEEADFSNFYKSTRLRHLLLFPVGCAVLFAFSKFDYRRFAPANEWRKSLVTYLMLVSIILLGIVLIPGIGREINYARRWLMIPLGAFSLSFQPSELAKWVAVLFTAGYCTRYSRQMHQFWKRFVPLCAITGLIAGLILIEDFGTSALIVTVALLMLITAGVRLWYLLPPIPFGIAAFFWAIMSSQARQNRILAFLHPEKWRDSINYQPFQSLIALGSGGIFGKGLGRGISKYGHLPADTTDFIFAIIGEELGLVGTGAVIILFSILIFLGMQVVRKAGDRFGQLAATGIVLMLGIQAAINIGVVTVVLPTKGIPLPFVSSGGTSMLLSAAAAGILINIANQTEQECQNLR